jgi:Protein of unknown function (DUF4232)
MKGTSVFPVATARPARAARLAIAVAAVACGAVVAGCSSSSSTPSTPTVTTTVTASPTSPAGSGSTSPGATGGTSAGSSPHAVGAAACATSVLQVKLGLGQGYAGGTYQVIDFTNNSSTSCTLYGYPGVSLVSGPSPYKQIGLAAKRNSTTPVKLITLAPGATANALLQIVDALNYPSSACGPTKATDLRIYPPNQLDPIYVATTAQGCSKNSQVLFVSAVAAGSGGNS